MCKHVGGGGSVWGAPEVMLDQCFACLCDLLSAEVSSVCNAVIVHASEVGLAHTHTEPLECGICVASTTSCLHRTQWCCVCVFVCHRCCSRFEEVVLRRPPPPRERVVAVNMKVGII